MCYENCVLQLKIRFILISLFSKGRSLVSVAFGPILKFYRLQLYNVTCVNFLCFSLCCAAADSLAALLGDGYAETTTIDVV